MSKTKKVFLLLLGICVVVLSVFFTACKETNNLGLNYGKYYLENSDDVYIEIKDDKIADLHNLDFSDFNPDEYWSYDDNWYEGKITLEEVIDAMQGEKRYWYDENDTCCFFLVKNFSTGGLLMEFDYNGTNELELNGHKYILK